MAFDSTAETTARTAMAAINSALTEKFVSVISFLAKNPDAASALRGSSAPKIGSTDYIKKQAIGFAESRKPKAPKPPETIPDEMVSIILEEYFQIEKAKLGHVKVEHQLSMGAENLVGELLERYLASVLENNGWIWCSGAMVRAVDFIKPPTTPTDDWRTLQVKNRDNSENSSSSAIRIGTTIEKWHRTFSKRTGTNWAAFPDTTLRTLLKEEDFVKFVKKYLQDLKTQEAARSANNGI
jgi:hypothetical protein